MTTPKDIDEILEDFTRRISSISEPDTLLAYDQQEEIDMQSNWLRTTITTITQHHEAEVERGVKKGKIQALHIMEDLYAKADDKADLMEMVNEAILTPTKTDKQK